MATPRPVVAQTPAPQAAATRPTAPPHLDGLPGIPARPDVVTVVPFYTKANETDLERTKAVIQADVDGIRGVFIIDTGDFDVDLNRTFLQPSATGGVDSVTAANRIPEQGWDTVHVRVRLGTLVNDYDAPQMAPNAHHGNAVLDHAFGNFSWVFAPRLGNLGVPALAPFETIVDYQQRRVVFVRLDSAGHRLADVPAYPVAATVPLVLMRDQLHWGLAAHMGTRVDTLLLDTGAPGAEAERQAADHLKQALAAGKPFKVARGTYGRIANHPGLGFTFLDQLGVVGFNFRTRQFILYGTTAAAPAH